MMSMIVGSLNVLGTINEAFWIFFLMEVLFERRTHFQRGKGFFGKCCIPWVPMILYIIIVMLLNRMTLTSPYTFVTAMLYSIVVVIIIWKSDLILSVAMVGTYGLGLLLKDISIMLIVGKIGGNSLIQKIAYGAGFERASVLFLGSLIWLLIAFAAYILIKKNNININEGRYLSVVCVISYVGLLFLGTQILTNFFHKIDIVIVFMLCIVGACIVIPYFMIKYREMVNQLRVVEARNELLAQSYDTVSRYYTSNAKLYHDMKHHLNAINYMLDGDEKVKIKEYVQSLVEFSEHYKKITYTGVDIIDVILSDKQKQAENKSIIFKVQTQMLPQDIGIEKKDLCAVFANLLDNALEAAEKEIEVKIKLSKQMLIIQFRNDFIVKPKKKNGYYQTTKKDSLYHGWGLKSVESVIEKYNGSMECVAENQIFVVNIIMNF